MTQREDDQLRNVVRGKTIVVKLGGSVGRDDTLPEDATRLQGLGARVVLVHGGGPLITGWLDRIGKETHFVDGLRYTDGETLEVVRMVLSGLVNGDVVQRIGVAGGRAIGLTGSDDCLLQAGVRDARLGLVGEITAVNPRPLSLILDAGYIVVVAPVAVMANDEGATFLNVNADTAAGELAAALGADRYVSLTDVDGIRDDSGEALRGLDANAARQMIGRGVIYGGMIPKVDACIRALAATREAQIVDGRQPHVLIRALLDPASVGTLLTPSA